MGAIQPAVKPEKGWSQEGEARALRAFLRGQGIPLKVIAAQKGCRPSYLSDLLACDRRAKPATKAAYDRLWHIAVAILRKRESHV